MPEFEQRPVRLKDFGRNCVSVHKFGGSSLATAECLERVVEIIDRHSHADDFIVVSANGKVTDELLAYTRGDLGALDRVQAFLTDLVDALDLSASHLKDFIAQQINRVKTLRPGIDEVLALGELCSVEILVELLKARGSKAHGIDARRLLSTLDKNDYQQFDQDYFEAGLSRELYGNFGKRLIVSGFIACDGHANTITLGRNGSDFTASLLAYFSGADKVCLWTDVAGIFAADPRLVAHAKPLATLSYNDANALASLGTNVLHGRSIHPLQAASIPLVVRSSCQAELPGTLVSHATTIENLTTVSSVALTDSVLLCSLENSNYRDSSKGTPIASEIESATADGRLIKLCSQVFNFDSEADTGVVIRADLFAQNQKTAYSKKLTGHEHAVSLVSLIGIQTENLESLVATLSGIVQAKIDNCQSGGFAESLVFRDHYGSLHFAVPQAEAKAVLNLVYGEVLGTSTGSHSKGFNNSPELDIGSPIEISGAPVLAAI